MFCVVCRAQTPVVEIDEDTGEERPLCRKHLPRPARKTYDWLVKRGWKPLPTQH